MENATGGVNSNVGAHSEVGNRTADLPSGFRNQVLLFTALAAVVIGAGWFLFASPSDTEVIDDRLARFGVPAAYVGEADDGNYLYTIDRACGDQIAVTITVGEQPTTEGPRPVEINEDGTRFIRLNRDTAPRFFDCE